MRFPTTTLLYLPFFFFTSLYAQTTLVLSIPSDSFDLNCPRCTTIVADVALTKGQRAIPLNLKKPVALNLFHWRYHDDISKEDVVTSEEPNWTTGRQLLEEVPAEEMMSLDINLFWTDSAGREAKIYLVIAGITKANLAELPVYGTFDLDTYAPMRFAAIAQITKDEKLETYDCIEGTCTLNSLNTKKRSFTGTFEFTGSRIGMDKRRFFVNGVFQK